jgi:hypothetical protein
MALEENDDQLISILTNLQLQTDMTIFFCGNLSQFKRRFRRQALAIVLMLFNQMKSFTNKESWLYYVSSISYSTVEGNQ